LTIGLLSVFLFLSYSFLYLSRHLFVVAFPIPNPNSTLTPILWLLISTLTSYSKSLLVQFTD
jgi:hypothetical protein